MLITGLHTLIKDIIGVFFQRKVYLFSTIIYDYLLVVLSIFLILNTYILHLIHLICLYIYHLFFHFFIYFLTNGILLTLSVLKLSIIESWVISFFIHWFNLVDIFLVRDFKFIIELKLCRFTLFVLWLDWLLRCLPIPAFAALINHSCQRD